MPHHSLGPGDQIEPRRCRGMPAHIDQLLIRHEMTLEAVRRHGVDVLRTQHAGVERLDFFLIARELLIVVQVQPVLRGAMAGFARNARDDVLDAAFFCTE